MRYFFGLFLLFFFSFVSAQYATEMLVALDGSGDYQSIQAAIDASKSFPDQHITIHVKAGVYEEKVKIHSWNTNLSLRGENPETTIIRWGDHFDKIKRGRNSTFHTATVLVQANNVQLEGLTIENTAGPVGQAIALAVEADQVTVVNCRLLGHQDTLYAAGANARQHYEQCYIEGTTDFIFGPATALFSNCTIHSKSNSYITAASTPPGRAFGFVFLHCQLTAAPQVKEVHLGRPWRSHAKTAFLYCEMGAHILPQGWDNWSRPANEQTAYYAEYSNTGPGAQTAQRVAWAHQLKRRQARQYQPDAVLAPFALPLMPH